MLVDIEFQKNIFKIKIFSNQVIFEAIAKCFFEDILNKKTLIPIKYFHISSKR